jgi:hypothetical protein
MAKLAAFTRTQGIAMQIERLNHLQFPPDSKIPAANVQDSVAARPNAAQPPTLPMASAVVRIQASAEESPTVAAASTVAATPAANVYSDTRRAGKPVAPDEDAQRKEQEYQNALSRSQASPARLSVGQDGVMVSARKTADAGNAPQDFMTVAVNTMREYANEAERQKRSGESSGAGAGGPGGGALRGIQQWTSKLKLFA